MRSYIIVFVSLLILSACENKNSPDHNHITPEVNYEDKITQSIEVVDSVEMVSEEQIKSDPTEKSHYTVGKATEPAKEVIDVDQYNSDPFKDPDYIGTPCGDYMNGRCTRHKHKNYKSEDFYPEIKLDSL